MQQNKLSSFPKNFKLTVECNFIKVMIKCAFVFSLMLFSICQAKSNAVPDPDALLKLIRAAVEDCYEDDEKTLKVEVTDAAFESLITNDPNPPRDTKCMRYCVMKSHKLYNDDGTLNIPQMQELFKEVYPKTIDDAKLDAIANTAEKCKTDVTIEDRCEHAHDMAMCMISKLAEDGVHF